MTSLRVGTSNRATSGTLEDPVLEAKRLLGAASACRLGLRLLGGVAVAIRCPSAARPPLSRTYKDLDFAARGSYSRAVATLLQEQGYEPDAEFNGLHGQHRLFFWDPANRRQADVFLDRVSMCHSLELGSRLSCDHETVSLADLLLLKLQVVETNERDYKDALALLLDHPFGPSGIDADYIARHLGSDWGWWRTATNVLGRLPDYARDLAGFDEAALVASRVEHLLRRIEREPKSRRWRLSAKVGERVRWYELPEEDSAPGQGTARPDTL